MTLAFAGTPDFAVRILAALLRAGHQVAAVYTQPDRRAGRGRRLAPGAVKRFALERGLQVHQPCDLAGPEHTALLRELGVDALVVAAYGLILPVPLLDAARHGSINVHASLLPRWRGAAPIQRAILAGDAVTGVSIMRMDEGLDTGPVYTTRETPIGPRDTAGTLHDRLAGLGAEALLEVLAALPGGVSAHPQPATGATYATRVSKAEARMDWHLDAVRLDRQVRAFNPAPVAWTLLHPAGDAQPAMRLRVLMARPGGPAPRDGAPGDVLDASGDGISVACGRGTLVVERLQPAGGKPMSAREFLASRALRAGTRLG